ncbi:AAA family ATPase [Pedobacter alluvionis]|uniref:AAA15 family ATPase/GTPase n=1 Tax=Pedobacter alluvionis TaxID=475253 RepID=A0A497Y2X9_9SPHI|nr:AAA family ATPase [Pedobacter alluvionis]RLJ77132.1 AAA15 family ATPase/GTPase [Pedobacter alluvionis]TFB33630.1 hypothetical protein E3V97_06195 [Pedobacter alluvionis]
MIKIKELKVKNFKSLYDTTISELGDVNLFVGYNNSGKSNIFKFLQLVFQPKEEREAVVLIDEGPTGRNTNTKTFHSTTTSYHDGYIYDTPFLFKQNNRKEPITFEITLEVANVLLSNNEALNKEDYLGESSTSITLVGEITSVSESRSKILVTNAKANGKTFYEIRDSIPFSFEKNTSGLSGKESESILSLFNNLVSYIDTDRNFTEELFNTGDSRFNSKNFKNWLYELNINSDKYEIFNELISFLSSFKFSAQALEELGGNIDSFPFTDDTQIGFSRFDQNVEVMLSNKGGRFPLKNFGTGIQQFFFILAKIFNSNSKVVIIEELELNLSQVYQIEILAFLKSLLGKKFDQFMFSSHSPFFATKCADSLDTAQHVTINGVGTPGTNVMGYTDPKSLVDKDGYHFWEIFKLI